MGHTSRLVRSVSRREGLIGLITSRRPVSAISVFAATIEARDRQYVDTRDTFDMHTMCSASVRDAPVVIFRTRRIPLPKRLDLLLPSTDYFQSSIRRRSTLMSTCRYEESVFPSSCHYRGPWLTCDRGCRSDGAHTRAGEDPPGARAFGGCRCRPPRGCAG